MALEFPLKAYEAREFNGMVACFPPPEFNMIAHEHRPDFVPIVGEEYGLAEAMRDLFYQPVDEGRFNGFPPLFIGLNAMALLHQHPDWISQRAFLAKFGLRPTMVFRSDVRWLRGQQVLLTDIRAFQIEDDED